VAASGGGGGLIVTHFLRGAACHARRAPQTPQMNSSSLDDVLRTSSRRGHRAYGESITELEHALQCATFNQRAGEPPAEVASAPLHDYGHLCHQMGDDIADHGVDARHEDLGATLIRVLFVDAVADAAQRLVAAKRYLCWRDPGCADGLSVVPRKSLHLQGGPMTETEAHEFEREPGHDPAVRARRVRRVRCYDNLGKVPGMKTPDLESFRPLLEAFLRPVC
jgi:predicted HD phosphohydrolase